MELRALSDFGECTFNKKIDKKRIKKSSQTKPLDIISSNMSNNPTDSHAAGADKDETNIHA